MSNWPKPEILLTPEEAVKKDILREFQEWGYTGGIGRYLTSRRHFTRKYGIHYMNIVKSEHCNTCTEVIHELQKQFMVSNINYVPFRIPTLHLNAVILLKCEKK